MKQIEIKRLSRKELEKMGVFDWPTWEKETSVFPWTYDAEEACYIIRGTATVTPEDSLAPVTIQAEDYVVFPAGMSCKWEIHEAIKKHYCFF